MSGIHNLRPARVVRAFERAGWKTRGQKGSHVQMTREGSPHVLSIPVHKGRAVKQGLLRSQIAKAGMTVEEFLALYK
jgi:predicted RNA binding protein YcfA (HicA-like mRNA interferase family)